MAVNGPSGTGKWAPMGNRIRPIIGLWSTLVPREEVSSSVVYRQFLPLKIFNNLLKLKIGVLENIED